MVISTHDVHQNAYDGGLLRGVNVFCVGGVWLGLHT